MKKPLIYLANLTHVREGRAVNEVVPLNIGCLASYLGRHLGTECAIELFHLPEDLERALARQVPDVLGVSSYAWNTRLNYIFLERFKALHPRGLGVMGGPNYPCRRDLQERFLADHPSVDYYVFLEGEEAFRGLIVRWLEAGGELGRMDPEPVPGCHRWADGRWQDGGPGRRLTDLESLPSPYLEGRLDRFLDTGLVPLLQGNRGCPYSCAYCACGAPYFNRVHRFPPERVFAELDYIRRRVKARSLVITDSNFGMFPEDQGLAERLARCRSEDGWPVSVTATTAKVHKQRVAECLRLLQEAVPFSASLQSAHLPTLQAVRRLNLGLDDFRDIRAQLKGRQVPFLCELIMPMPEETAASHLEGIRLALEGGIDSISPYTCMLLKGAALSEDHAFDRYGQVRRFRIVPRGFGEYLGRRIVESEEVCVGTASLSFEEYLGLRGMHLVISNFFNLGAFREVVAFLRGRQVPVFSWLERVHARLAADRGEAGGLYERFLAETREELWESEAALQERFAGEAGFSDLLSGRAGTNLLNKNQALALDRLDLMGRVAVDAAGDCLGPGDREVLSELVRYCVCLRGGVFSRQPEALEETFSFDIPRWQEEGAPADRAAFPGPTRLRFVLEAAQRRMLEDYYVQYGEGLDSRGKILTRLHPELLYRRCERVPAVA